MAVVFPFPSPWETNFERQADEAFYRAEGASAAELRKLRPPLPQIRMNPPRFGYKPYIDRIPTIWSVFGLEHSNGTIPDMKQFDRVDYSQQQSQDQGSDRNSNYDSLGNGSTGTSG